MGPPVGAIADIVGLGFQIWRRRDWAQFRMDKGRSLDCAALRHEARFNNLASRMESAATGSLLSQQSLKLAGSLVVKSHIAQHYLKRQHAREEGLVTDVAERHSPLIQTTWLAASTVALATVHVCQVLIQEEHQVIASRVPIDH